MQLNDFQNKSWKEVREICNQPLLLAFSEDKELMDSAALIRDHGPKAGAAYISAVLMARKNPLLAIQTGAYYYRELAKKQEISELQQAIVRMEELTAWGSVYFDEPPLNWPIKPPKELLTKNGSMLNLLLYEGARKLDLDWTTDHLVLMGVSDFLKWLGEVGGLNKLKRGKRRK